MFSSPVFITNLLGLIFVCGIPIYGLLQIIKLLRQIRIINSMTLKTILKISEKYGVEIDIKSIQKEVEDNL
jgi:hypothetical protein